MQINARSTSPEAFYRWAVRQGLVRTVLVPELPPDGQPMTDLEATAGEVYTTIPGVILEGPFSVPRGSAGTITEPHWNIQVSAWARPEVLAVSPDINAWARTVSNNNGGTRQMARPGDPPIRWVPPVGGANVFFLTQPPASQGAGKGDAIPVPGGRRQRTLDTTAPRLPPTARRDQLVLSCANGAVLLFVHALRNPTRTFGR